MHLDLWNSTLDADMNFRYWSTLTRYYSRGDVGIKIFLAVMSSGTVAAWGFWSMTPNIWKTLSAISALIAIASPILNLNKSIKAISDLAGKWQMLLISYEELGRTDASLDSAQSLKKLASIKKLEGKIKSSELGLPNIKWVLNSAFKQVKNSRGLS